MQLERLNQERLNWRRNHPFGFWTKPKMDANGVVNLQAWSAGIPGPINTPWQGGVFTLDLFFPPNYPAEPPTAVFSPVLFHPNIYPNGMVCLDLLTAAGWNASFTVAHILVSIQALLCNPNPTSPAQLEAFQLYVNDRARYEQIVQAMAARCAVPSNAQDEEMTNNT